MKYRKEAVHATNPEVLAAGRRKLVFAALAVLAVVLVAGTWLLVHSLQPKQNDAAVKPETAVSQPKTVEKKQATESAEHHGNSPDCPDTDCIAMLVNGDLLFHEGLWNQYASTNTAATDGTAFDFTGLFEPMRKYIDASDIAVCEFETPIAQRGGPYTGYPVFNIPAEVADAAKNVVPVYPCFQYKLLLPPLPPRSILRVFLYHCTIHQEPALLSPIDPHQIIHSCILPRSRFPQT